MNRDGFDVFRKRVLLKGTLTTLTGLHIGMGRGTGLLGTDSPVIKDFMGRPFIPGSSVKGVLRSTTESFLRPVQERAKGERLVCNVIDDRQRCIPNRLKQKILEDESDPDTVIWERSCWVCRLFGSPWLASKAQILDLQLASPFFRPEWVAVRDGVAIDRDTETAAAHLKYDFEVVPPETVFSLEILVENPEDFEMGLLVHALDSLNEGFSLLGGIKSRGLGRVRVDVSEIREDTVDSILNRASAVQAPTTDVEGNLKGYRDALWKKLNGLLGVGGGTAVV